MSVRVPLRIVTASLAPGDAIGNYILTLRRILDRFGFAVEIYADHVAPEYGGLARHSDAYRAHGGILWFHYSIYADNLRLIDEPAAYRIMDFHGVSPPSLFAGYDVWLADLCRRGIEALPGYVNRFDLCVVHSDYSRELLESAGCVQGGSRPEVVKLPLVVDETRFDGREDPALSAWLARLDYLLFVGRIVPQKDILAMVEIFARVCAARPETALILAGPRQLAPGYQREIEARVRRLGLENRVLLAGPISAPAMLAGLYRHAAFTLITSEWETFCVPVVESMAFGTPVAAHCIPPLPEVLGGAGLLIDKGRPDEAASAILRTWEDRAMYARLSEAGRRRAARFTGRSLEHEVLRMLSRAFRHEI